MKILRHAVPVLLAFGLGMMIQRTTVFNQTQKPSAGSTLPGSSTRSSTSGNATDGAKQAKTAATGSVAEILQQMKSITDYEDSSYFLRNTLGSASPERLAALAAELSAMPVIKQEAHGFCFSLAKYWAKSDSAAALAWAQTLPMIPGRNTISGVFAGMGTENSAAALALADSLPDVKMRKIARSAIANAMAKRDPEQALALMSQVKDANNYYSVAEIYGQWAEKDPLAAQQAVAALPNGQLRTHATQYVYGKLASEDPAGAAASASALTSPAQRKVALAAVLSSWGQNDPDAAWAYVQTLPPNDPARNAQSTILGSLAGTDPLKAIALLGQLGSNTRKDGLLSNVISNWAQNDPTAALAYAAGLTDPRERKQAVQNLGSALDFSDPVAIKKLFTQFPAPAERKAMVRSYIGNHAYNDAAGCVGALAYLTPSDQDRTMNETSLMHYLADQDPDLAIKTLQSNPGPKSDQHWSNLISNLTEMDPAKAYQALQGLPLDAQNKALPNYLSSLARQDVAQAMALAKALPEGDTKVNSMSNVLSSWANQDPDAVWAWAQTATGKERGQALENVISQKGRDDPAAATKLFSTLLSSGQEEDKKTASSAVSGLSSNLYRNDPASATQWAAQLTDEKMQKTAINNIASQWTQEDPVEASVWIKQLPIGEAKDSAVQSLISNIKGSDPESAFAWALASGKEGTRVSLATTVLTTWLKNDPAAAKQALLRSPLSEEQRNSLLKNH